MNKMFTAVSIGQLVEGEKIKLTDPLGKYLPDYPNADVASKVTIHHLLTHTGGTGDIFGPEFAKNRLKLKELGTTWGFTARVAWTSNRAASGRTATTAFCG
jgi:D-alanyl-D-alanine carboxypeptidase